MTILPIVERELRVASRRKGTYGIRVKIAAAATLAFVACYVASQTGWTVSFVKTLFWGLSGLCMLYCLAAGRLMTADCLSRENREGTLGLLFLTDLKGYDVVLGKLAATSLDGFYGLLAVIPMLAIPLLAGGMTNGEFWRMVLVLINTFLFSLAIGLYVSSVTRDEQKAMAKNFALLLCLAAVLPAIAGLLELSLPRIISWEKWLFYSCPIYAFWQCADTRYKVSPNDFWWSVSITFSLTFLLLLLASWTAPRSWQDKPVPARSLPGNRERRRRWWRQGSAKRAREFRKRLLGLNAYYWLAARPYLKVSYVWAAVGTIGCLWLFTSLSVRNIEDEANIVFALLLCVLLKLWITTEAGRQLAEDKKSGAFELLLSTPLTVRDIVRGQRLALRRQFLKPVAAAAVMGLILMVFVHRGGDAAQERCLWLAGILMLVADVITLSWVAMLAALTAKNHGRATIQVAACILVLPWFLFAGAEFAIHLFMFLFSRQAWNPDWHFDLGCWFGVGILTDLVLVVKARRRLQTRFRQLALEPYAPKRRFAWLRDLRSGSRERKVELRAKYRRVAVVTAAALTVGAGLVLYDILVSRANPPKALVVSIAESNSPARVSGVPGCFLFILPDGTLWRWGDPNWDRKNLMASPPVQVGSNRDWVQIVSTLINGQSFSDLGLRSNGTIWTWTSDRDIPKQFGSDHDWVEVCAGNGFNFARKRDGTLWGWGNDNQNQLGIGPGPHRTDAVRVGTNNNWKAIHATDWGAMALRSDGTLWTWGNLNYLINGKWITTNNPVPIQFCRESNWVALSDGLENGFRNKVGEFWRLNDLRIAFPGANVSVSSLGSLIGSNGATISSGPLFTTNWNHAKYEVRTNGTLWANPLSWINGTLQANPLSGPPVRVGQRSDWVSVWGTPFSMIGLTSDGTLWTWGADCGHESHWVEVFGERIRFLEAIIGHIFGATDYSDMDYISLRFPTQKEPRPLLRVVFTNSASGSRQ
jgi:hypothetical protein